MLNLIVNELLIIFPFVYPQQPAGAWHGYIEDDLHPSQVGQEHPEDHPVHEDGLSR